MIVDAFLYDGENRLAKARVEQLDGVVDAHIAVSANRTHQGVERTDYGELGPFLDPHPPPVFAEIVDLSSFDGTGRGGVGTEHYQERERAHRDAIPALLSDYPDETVLLLSDVDEIPHPHAVQRAAVFVGALATRDDRTFDVSRNVAALEQRMHAFALDWLHPQNWLGTTAARLGWARQHGCQAMRNARGNCPQLVDGGWHLTWLGGPAAWRRKIDSFSHAEISKSDAELLACWRNGVDVNGMEMRGVDLDGTYPAAFRNDTLPEWWLRPRNEKA